MARMRQTDGARAATAEACSRLLSRMVFNALPTRVGLSASIAHGRLW